MNVLLQLILCTSPPRMTILDWNVSSIYDTHKSSPVLIAQMYFCEL